MKKSELRNIIKEVINSLSEGKENFGIEVISGPKGVRGKSIGKNDIERVKEKRAEFLEKYPKKATADNIDNYIASTCQNLTNKQLAQAYVELGIYDELKNTYTVKAAKKQMNK